MEKGKHRLCQIIVLVFGVFVSIFVLPKVPLSFEQSHPGSVVALMTLFIGLVLVGISFFAILLRLYQLLHEINLTPINRQDVDKIFQQLTRNLASLAVGFALCLPAINAVAATIDVPGIRALGFLFVLIPIIARTLMIHLTVFVRQ